MHQGFNEDFRVGFSDLVRAALSLSSPSRPLDLLVHAMIGGGRFRNSLSRSDVRSHMWLAGEIPSYTSNAVAISVLAHGFGLSVRVLREDGGRKSVQVTDDRNGGSWVIKTSYPAGAAIAGVVRALRVRGASGNSLKAA